MLNMGRENKIQYKTTTYTFTIGTTRDEETKHKSEEESYPVLHTDYHSAAFRTCYSGYRHEKEWIFFTTSLRTPSLPNAHGSVFLKPVS